MIASVDRGEPALLFTHGGDQMGYSHVSDWLRAHPPQSLAPGGGPIGPAVEDPSQPYSAWPHLMLTTETRAGAFAYLALVSWLSGQSATFSFNAAAAIALIAACLGCAAIFSKAWTFLLGLATALLTCLWYDYGQTGFLGKLLGYPLVFFTFGVFVAFYRSKIGPTEMLLFLLLASGAALMHAALGYALLFTCLAVPFVLASAVIERKPPRLADYSLAIFPSVIAMIASGTMARALAPPALPDFGVQWNSIAFIATDLNSLFPDVALVSPPVLKVLFVLCVAAWPVLALVAAKNRDAAALGLLCGPAALIVGLYAFDQRMAAVQVGGFLYPAALCAGFLLTQQFDKGGRPIAGRRYVFAVGTVAVLIALHIPRTIGAVLRHTVEADRRQMFAVSDFDRLQSAIGDREVYVDVRGNNRTVVPIMVELGRRNVGLVWSPDSWHFAAAFRGWPPPKVEKIPDLRLINSTEQPNDREHIVVETRRYKLLEASATQGSQNRE
jgi:hypothetical protein